MSMSLKLATWNMAFWSHKSLHEQAWKYFVEEVDADIYLFQEASPPSALKDDPNFLWFEIGGNRNWGTGIYSRKYPLRHLSIKTQYAGSLVLAEATVAGKIELTIISMYGLFETIENTRASAT